MAITLGLEKFLHDIRYRRDRYRQFIGIVFVIFVSIMSKPNKTLFMIGSALVFMGIMIRLWASGHIKKNKALATDGPYAYVRHPLYVGNITMGTGFALASGLWWAIPLFVIILITFYPQAIQREDDKLHRAFQEDWENWRQKTPALLPRIENYDGTKHGNWSFWQSLRQNGEPIIALFLLFLLYIISSSL